MSSITQPVYIYQARSAEIEAVLTENRKRFPVLSSRIDKAEEILFTGSLSVEPCAWNSANVVHWKVRSQSHDGYYLLNGTHNHCGCPDRGERIGDVKFCKHSIAVATYRRVLKDQFNDLVQVREMDLGILPNGEFHAYAKSMGYVQVAKVNDGYAFVDMQSAVRFSIWLAKSKMTEFASYFNSKRELVAA